MYTWSATGDIISLIIRTAKNGKPYLSVGVKYAENSVAWHIAWSTDFVADAAKADDEGRVEKATIAGVDVAKGQSITMSGPISSYGEGASKKESKPIKRVTVNTFAETSTF
jgi:hypothetical protein